MIEFGVIYSLLSHHLFASNTTKVFPSLFFFSLLQNMLSGPSYVVLDVLPETGNFPDSGGIVQLFEVVLPVTFFGGAHVAPRTSLVFSDF